MFAWLTERARSKMLTSSASRIEKFTESLRESSPDALGWVLAQAVKIRIDLENEGTLPKNFFYVIPSDRMRHDFARPISLALGNLAMNFSKNGKDVMASCTSIWWYTSLAIANTQLEEVVAEMWEVLSQGCDYVADGEEYLEIAGVPKIFDLERQMRRIPTIAKKKFK